MERHRLDVLSLTGGVIATAIALLGLTDALTLSPRDLAWSGPLLLVLIGLALVLSTARTRQEAPADDHADDHPDDHADDAASEAAAER